MSYQKTIVVGNLGADPEMRYMENGTPVTNFSIATNRRWTNQKTGEQEEETIWFRVSVWGKQAEHCHQYLEKGRQVLVEGRLRPDPKTGGPRLWSGQDGVVRASYEINADPFGVRFLSGGDAAAAPAAAGTRQQAASEPEEDEIPF